MMKKLFKILFPFFFLFLIISPILARQDRPATPSATHPRYEKLEEARERVRERKETIRLEIQERRATRAARLAERRKERIRVFFTRLKRRMQAAINRLERLIARIKSRLSRIEAADEDIDTAPIRETLDGAEDKLASASAALTQAQTSLEDILDANDPKEAFTDVRDLIKEIKEQLKETHQILVHVIGDIKGLRVGQGDAQPEVTPAPEVTPSPSPSPEITPSPEATPTGG